MPKQVNVLSWVDENVPIKDRKQFRVEMIKWDNGLEKLPISYWPSYDEDVLIVALKYAQNTLSE